MKIVLLYQVSQVSTSNRPIGSPEIGLLFQTADREREREREREANEINFITAQGIRVQDK